jgi:hypothetical protein
MIRRSFELLISENVQSVAEILSALHSHRTTWRKLPTLVPKPSLAALSHAPNLYFSRNSVVKLPMWCGYSAGRAISIWPCSTALMLPSLQSPTAASC